MTGQIQQARVKRVNSAGLQIEETYWLVEEDGSQPLINILQMPLTHKDLVVQIQELQPVLIVWDTLRKIHTLSESASESAIAPLELQQDVPAGEIRTFCVAHNTGVGYAEGGMTVLSSAGEVRVDLRADPSAKSSDGCGCGGNCDLSGGNPIDSVTSLGWPLFLSFGLLYWRRKRIS